MRSLMLATLLAVGTTALAPTDAKAYYPYRGYGYGYGRPVYGAYYGGYGYGRPAYYGGYTTGYVTPYAYSSYYGYPATTYVAPPVVVSPGYTAGYPFYQTRPYGYRPYGYYRY